MSFDQTIIPTNTPNQYGRVAVNPDGSNIGGGVQGKLDIITQQTDYLQTFAYLDAGAVDERVSTIVHSSVLLSQSVTETFSYTGTSPNYRISTITLS